MNAYRFFGILAALALVASCGGGGGSSAPAATPPPPAVPPSLPPPDEASFAGMWTAIDPEGFPVTAYSTDNGVFHWRGGLTQTGVGLRVSVTGDSVSMNLLLLNPLRYDDGSVSANCTVTGTFDERVSIALSGVCTTALNSRFDLLITFTYDDQYERGSSLDVISGLYSVPGGDVLRIDSLGLLFMQMGILGCVVNGQVSIIDSQWNAYEASVTYANCVGPLAIFNDVPMTGTLFLNDNGGSDQIVTIFSGPIENGAVSLSFFATRT